MSDVLGQALALEANGCSVIRAAVDGTKAPLGAWKQWQSERPSEEQLRAWLGDGHPGIGIVCGAVSGNLETLEFEGRAVSGGLLAEADRLMTAAGLQEIWRKLTDGYAEVSPSRGLHLPYRVDGEPVSGNIKLAERPARDDELIDEERAKIAELAAKGREWRPKRTLIETRGEGGFIIVAPSHGTVHPSGKPWVLASGGPATIPVLTAAERREFHRVIRSLDQMPQPEPDRAGFQQPGHDGKPPGEDYNERADWADILEPSGWTLVATLGDGTRNWRRPDKKLGMSATTGRPPYDNLYVFSTSTEFDAEKPYSKFGAYALMHHGDDYSAAAAQLRREGYGDQPQATSSQHDNRKDPPRPSTSVPACDPGMFRGVPGDIVEAADAGTEADKVGVYASLLSAVSALIGNSPCVLIGNSRHPLLIWSLLIGRTNIGRKGEAASTAMRVVRRATDDVYDITESGLSSGEGLIERLRDIDDAEDTGGTNDKRLLVIETEMAMVMAACAREGTKLPGILRQAWEGDRLASLNRKRIVASYSHIAIMGHITPREFRAKLRDSDLAGGTWNRYLPFYVERRRRIPLPTGLDEDTQLPGLAKKLGEAIELAEKIRAIDLTEDAARLWSGELYQEFTEFDEDTAAADFVQRAAPYCRRVAALHAALDGRGSASAADLQAAAHLIRYSIASARYVLDPAPRDVRLDKLRRAVDEAGMAGLSREAARNVFGGHVTRDEMDNLIEQLCADGSYVQEEIKTSGRPRTVIRAARKARKA